MGYFPVRYDSRAVNYDRRGFIILATGLFINSFYFVLFNSLEIYIN